MYRNIVLLAASLFLFAGCASSKATPKKEIQIDKTSSLFKPAIPDKPLSSMNIIDRNGLSETITSTDRLKMYQSTNFVSSQPYQKVLRVYAKDLDGNNLSVITSYHPNGQIKQYLEVMNGRAFGQYVEWHSNGQRKLFCRVVAGAADIDEKSILTWAFDGVSFAWDENGKLKAEVPYEKGELHGIMKSFHPNGQIAQRAPYIGGNLHGCLERFDETGARLEESNFFSGIQDGESIGFWKKGIPAWKENYIQGLLENGKYYDKNGQFLSQVQDGAGERTVYDEANNRRELQQYVEGELDGTVAIYEESSNTLLSSYAMKNGQKHGLETLYFPPKPFAKGESAPRPKMQIDWFEGKINGLVKTWYENGAQESQKEMSNNLKQGILMAWYHDGSVMLVEEYEKDRLMRGEYRKRGERAVASRIDNGKGIATLFDANGHFAQKVQYRDGKPVDDVVQ